MLKLHSIFSSVTKDRRGNVIITFAFFMVVLGVVVSLVIDGSRAITAHARAGQALDAASLAAARSMNDTTLTDAELTTIAQNVFNANLQGQTDTKIYFGTLTVNIDRANNKIETKIAAEVETFFSKIINIAKIDVSNSSTAIYNIKDIELSMMLDVTGSMEGSKINDLKTASKAVVDILLANKTLGNKTRVALSPYAASVNVGGYAAAFSDGDSKDGCVVERLNATHIDTAPAAGTYFRGITQANIDSNKIYKKPYKNYGCPKAVIMPLTDDASTLKSRIDTFQAAGATAGHIGLAWAWYMISPNWGGIWPSSSEPDAYKKKNVIKAIIMMTDGEFNTAFLNSPDTVEAQSFNSAANLCTNIKNEDVVIYTVGFKAPTKALNALKNCATSPAHHFDAKNGKDLINAFKEIATHLTKLRITK